MKTKKFKTALIFTALSFLASILSYVFNLIVARSFSLEIYGEYSATIAAFLFFSVIFNTINTIVVKKVSKQQNQKKIAKAFQLERAFLQLLGNSWQWFILAGFFAFIFFTKAIHLSRLSVIMLLFYLLIMLAFNFYFSLIQGLKKYFLHGKLNISWGIFKVVLLFIAIFLTRNLFGIYVSLILATLFTVILAVYFLHRQRKASSCPQQKISLPKLIKQAQFYQPLLINFALMGLLVIDVIMAKRFFNAQQVGLYSSLSLFARLIFYFFCPIIQMAYTNFSQKQTQKEGLASLTEYFLIIVGIGLVIIAGYSFLPSLIIKIVVGEKFLQITPILFLSAIFGVLYSLLQLQTFYWLAKDKKQILSLMVFFFLSLVLMQFWHANFANMMIINIVVSLLANVWLLRKNLALYFL